MRKLDVRTKQYVLAVGLYFKIVIQNVLGATLISLICRLNGTGM